jgi:hypothetical protein
MYSVEPVECSATRGNKLLDHTITTIHAERYEAAYVGWARAPLKVVLCTCPDVVKLFRRT